MHHCCPLSPNKSQCKLAVAHSCVLQNENRHQWIYSGGGSSTVWKYCCTAVSRSVVIADVCCFMRADDLCYGIVLLCHATRRFLWTVIWNLSGTLSVFFTERMSVKKKLTVGRKKKLTVRRRITFLTCAQYCMVQYKESL